MKRLKFILAALAACAVVYAGLCVRAIQGRPPLDFDADLEPNARISITDWYETTHRLPTAGFDMGAVVHAMANPRSPFRYRPWVSYGGLAGEGTIMVSYLNYVAVFTEQDGRWTFVWDETA